MYLLPRELQAVITEFLLQAKLADVHNELKQKVTLTEVDYRQDFLCRFKYGEWRRREGLQNGVYWGQSCDVRRCVGITEMRWNESLKKYLYYRNSGYIYFPMDISPPTIDRTLLEVYTTWKNESE